MSTLKELIAKAYEAHMGDHTATADFEACKNNMCQLAYAAETELATLKAALDNEIQNVFDLEMKLEHARNDYNELEAALAAEDAK